MTRLVTTPRLILLLLICMLGTVSYAQSTPRWVKKGVAELDKERTNDTYAFQVFHTHSQDISKIQREAPLQLKQFVIEKYGAQDTSVVITEIPNTTEKEYKVEYRGVAGEKNIIIAELVDTYSSFEDFELNVFEYEYYQLYAVSKPNVAPMFDDFTLTQKYNSKAVVLSLVPGLGQLYKGQETKGYVIMGGEVFLIGSALYFNYKARDSHDMRYKEPEFADSWRSKEHSWMNFRTGAICGAIALYAYNLIDAATSKGARQVVVSKPKSYNLSVVPYATVDQMGMSLCLKF